MSHGPHVATPDPYLVERVNSRSSFRPGIWFKWWARDQATEAVPRRRAGIAEFRSLLAAREPTVFYKIP